MHASTTLSYQIQHHVCFSILLQQMGRSLDWKPFWESLNNHNGGWNDLQNASKMSTVITPSCCHANYYIQSLLLSRGMHCSFPWIQASQVVVGKGLCWHAKPITTTDHLLSVSVDLHCVWNQGCNSFGKWMNWHFQLLNRWVTMNGELQFILICHHSSCQ